jgi:TPR repeat protein
LGYCYHKGIGVRQFYRKAVELYTLSAEQGFDLAQLQLGRCYFFGVGINKDKAKAREWYAKAAEQGNRDAQYAIDSLNGKSNYFSWIRDLFRFR